MLAQKRLDIKLNFDNARKLPGANMEELILKYLSIMGHNVVNPSMVGSLQDNKVSKDPNNVIEEDIDLESSNWQVSDNQDTNVNLDCENPYSDSFIGVTTTTRENKTNRKTRVKVLNALAVKKGSTSGLRKSSATFVTNTYTQ